MNPEKLSRYINVHQTSAKAYVYVEGDSFDVDSLLELRNQMLIEQRTALKTTMHSLRMQLFQLEKQLADTEQQLSGEEHE